jgi:peptidoglycan/xylan/chitin deacetylase (PgdA/CDA1 family)
MAYLPKKVPKIVQWLFPTLVWKVNTYEKTIYLTFDDGPTPKITDWVLDQLAAFNAKATFFCIGKNIEENPKIFRRLQEEGHGIGNHTHNHLKGWATNTKDYLANVKECNKVMMEYSNSKFQIPNSNAYKLFRPPYGRIKIKQLKAIQDLGYKIVMWNVLPVDWSKGITPEACASYVLNNAKSGSIVVFHDSVKASRNMQYALPKVLQHFTEKGFIFKRIL